jgi:plasmid stabilization system protein ParE
VKRWKVVIPPVVQEQIRAQVLYIARDSIENALNWEDRLLKAIEKIGEMPGHARDEEATIRLGFAVQKDVFEGTYLIHYRTDDQTRTVDLLNFRHGARLPRAGEP